MTSDGEIGLDERQQAFVAKQRSDGDAGPPRAASRFRTIRRSRSCGRTEVANEARSIRPAAWRRPWPASALQSRSP